jgi:hypothetical protein
MRSTFCAFLLLLAACTYNAVPSATHAPVVGTAEEQKAFAGLWRGTIDATDDRLDGPIEFRLQPNEIFFTSDPRTPRKILWVRFDKGKFTGATDEWRDTTRNVNVYTTFEGSMAEDGSIRGTIREKVGTQWSDVGTFTARHVTE